MAADSRGLIFNIQRFSLHDGTGIRTLVFLKGCPLRCGWCANPEGQSAFVEIRYDKVRCIGCTACIGSCPKDAVTHDPADRFTIDRSSCNKCGSCVEACPSGAKSRWGEYRRADEIVAIVKRDAIFYRHSDGGITIGGGEALFQPSFTHALLRKCRESGLNTALETSGYGSWPWLRRIAKCCDTVFYDLKVMDSEKHLLLTGVGNELILANLTALDRLIGSSETHKNLKLVIRVPVIPDVNSDTGTIKEIGSFVRTRLLNVAKVELLPFHNISGQKYEQLGLTYSFKGMTGLKDEQMQPLKQLLTDMGLPCSIMSW